MSDATPELFPYILLRIAGGPHGDLQKTDTPLSSAAAAEIIRQRSEIQQLGDIIAEDLYAAIPAAADPSSRRFWLAIKRDVHNQRQLPHISRQAYAVLPDTLRKKLRRYSRLQAKLSLLEKEAEQQYAQETAQVREAFATLLRKPNLRNGLLLSSTTINPSLQKYLNSAHNINSPITKKERSFMEYLSRMYTKPSPFSSFTHLAIATLSKNPDEDYRHPPGKGNEFTAISRIELNHELYKYLSGLLTGKQEIRRQLPIKLNPTIRKADGAYHFLTNYHNQEAFQHITASPSLDIFYTLAGRTLQPQTYSGLTQEVIGKKYINASAKEINQYIDQLIDLGFFEIELGISGIDREWDKKLVQLLSSLAPQQPQLTNIVRGLTKVKELATNYEAAPTAKRQRLLQQAHQTFQATCELLGATVPKQELPASEDSEEKTSPPEKVIFRRISSTDFTFEPHKLWYEDTALTKPQILPSALKSNMQTLGDLLARLRQFDGCLNEREHLFDFFKTTYGPSATIDLLELYRDYSLHKQNSDKTSGNAQSKRKKANRQALNTFQKQLGTDLSGDEVHISRDAIAHLEPAAPPASFGAFLHAYGTGANSRLVLSTTTDGYGKMFSRFLYLFDDVVTERIRGTWKTHSEGALLAEVTDASFFNANLHPRIMPYEIITPGGHAALSPAAQLHVGDLTVSCASASQERLTLMHRPSGKEVIVFDLGFQGKKGRSNLYSLLCTFGPGPHHSVHALLDRINQQAGLKTPDAHEITVLPRVVYENSVVLQRKVWRIPKEKLPLRTATETDWTYFLRVQQWRQALHLPDEVFIRGAQYKPQYVSFHNPFLVALFASSARNSTEMHIEEMLPNGEQLALTRGRVTELFVQWNRA